MTAYPTRLMLLVPGVLAAMALALAPCHGKAADIAGMVERATSGTSQERYVAIDDLGEHHESAETVVPALQKLLGDKDPQVQWRSARALGDYGDLAKTVAPELRKLLGNADPIVKYHAATALGKLEDRSDETARALAKLVTNKDGRVARAAIAALRKLNPDPKLVMDTIQQVMESDDEAVQLFALEAVVARGAAATPILIEALQRPQTAYLACTAIQQIGPAAKETVPAISTLLTKTKHSQLQIAALLALASIGPAAQPAEGQIETLLKTSQDATVPVAAAYALGSIGAKNADATLRAAMMKENSMLQMLAAWALAMLHPEDQASMKQAVDKLTDGLGSNDAAMRMAAVRGMRKLNAPPELVAPALVRMANDPNPDVSANVVAALADVGEPIVPRVAKALSKPELRGLAIRVIKKLGPKAAGAVDALVDAANGADAMQQADIYLALAAIGPSAAPATDVLAKSLKSDDDHVRHAAIFALRQIGPGATEAVPQLVSMLGDQDSMVALASAWALAAIAGSDGGVASKVAPVLAQGLVSADERAQLESVDAIVALGPGGASAAPILKKLAEEDDSESVREAAAEALKK